MSTSDLPIHVQMLMALRLKVQQRQRDHERRTGKGMEDREYQRHVGRIAECETQVTAINEMMKADLDEVADQLENEKYGEQGSTRSSRAGKRRPAASAHNG